MFTAAGADVITTPPPAPRANTHANTSPYAERWAGTARRECLDRMPITGQRHHAAILDQYTTHYHQHHPHRSPGQQPPAPRPQIPNPAAADTQPRPTLGALINEHTQAA